MSGGKHSASKAHDDRELSRNESTRAQAGEGEGASERAGASGAATDPYRLANPYVSEGALKRQNKLKRAGLVVGALVLAALLAIGGWFAWDALRNPSIDEYKNEQIEIHGLLDDSFYITPLELSQLKCERITAKGTGAGEGGVSKAGVVSAYGPTLQTFVSTFGQDLQSFRRVKFTCKDGYYTTFRADALANTIILSIASGKEALYDKQQPLRVVAPSEESGKWAYGVVRIDFLE